MIRIERKDPCLERLTIVWMWEDLEYRLAGTAYQWRYRREESKHMWTILWGDYPTPVSTDVDIVALVRDGQWRITD